jgi:hypothetical protein
MYLDADGFTCRHHKKSKVSVVSNVVSSVGCDAIEYDATSMEVHYSKSADADGRFEKGTVAIGKCRSVDQLFTAVINLD